MSTRSPVRLQLDSDVVTAIRKLSFDGTNIVMGAPVDMNSQKILALADGTADTDAAAKSQAGGDQIDHVWWETQECTLSDIQALGGGQTGSINGRALAADEGVMWWLLETTQVFNYSMYITIGNTTTSGAYSGQFAITSAAKYTAPANHSATVMSADMEGVCDWDEERTLKLSFEVSGGGTSLSGLTTGAMKIHWLLVKTGQKDMS